MVRSVVPQPVVTGVVIVMTTLWAVNVVIGFIDPARHDTTFNTLFAIVVGGLFTLARGKDKSDG